MVPSLNVACVLCVAFSVKYGVGMVPSFNVTCVLCVA